MRTKICGLTNLPDARAAINSGADALGFVMGGSVLPWEIEPRAQDAREIVKALGGADAAVETYLVTHLDNAEDILDLADYVGCSGIQISEYVAVAELQKLRARTQRTLIKTIVTTDTDYLEKMWDCFPYVDALLTDTRKGGYVGGTGHENDWAASAELVREAQLPVWVAGGLRPETVASVIKTTQPQGVDVSTGVSRFGPAFPRKDIKDHQKIEAFIRAAKEAAQGASA